MPYNHLFSVYELGVNVDRGYCTLLVDLCSALCGPWMGVSWFIFVSEFVLVNAFMILSFLLPVALTVTYLWFGSLPISVCLLLITCAVLFDHLFHKTFLQV